MAFISGNRDSFAAQNDHILDLKEGLTFLRPKGDGVALLKKLGMHSFMAKSFKHEWTEVALAGRSEAVTLADGTATTLTVSDAYIYQVNDLIRIESEIVRVTALASATTLTIVRAYAGTTGVAHSAKTAMNLGSADPENAAAPAGQSDSSSRLYNYVQTFTRGVDLSTDEIMQASTDGNPLQGQLARRTIEWYQKFSAAMFYGVRYEDTTNKIHAMGGLKHFVTTNVTNVAGALTIALIDAKIKAIVDAGGDPDVIVVGTAQKQKLDALDANVVRTGKRNSDKVGGANISQTWQSGILDHELDVIVDLSLLPDELWILDTNYLRIGSISGNGETGTLGVVDSTTPGKDGTSKVIRGKYTFEVMQQLAQAYLYGLT
jgi:hypothetical protein